MTYQTPTKKVLILLMAIFVASGSVTSARQTTPAERSVVLMGKSARDLFKTCSRPAPMNVTGFWSPSKNDIATMEAALPVFLFHQKLPKALRMRGVRDYFHQCAGYTRGGKKWIYINAFHPDVKKQLETAAKGRFDWRDDPVSVCDGGTQFFGVEYNVADKTFHDFSFNGPYEID